MKLKYNRDSELEVVGFGVFKPNQTIKIDNESEAKRYLDSGYFNVVKERKKEFKPKIIKLEAKELKRETKEVEPEVVKIEEKKVKKSKKKGDDKLCHKDQEDL